MPYTNLTARKESPKWSERLEIIAIELELFDSKQCLKLFTAFLETTVHYDKVLITGDFNFPDLTWNTTLLSNLSDGNPSSGSAEFRELSFDFFLHQVNMCPTRFNHILDLVLTSAPENIVNLLCIPPKSMDISTDHHLMFFDFLLHVKSTGCDKRTVFDFEQQTQKIIQIPPSLTEIKHKKVLVRFQVRFQAL